MLSVLAKLRLIKDSNLIYTFVKQLRRDNFLTLYKDKLRKNLSQINTHGNTMATE